MFEDSFTLKQSNLSEKELVMKYKTRVYGIVHGGYNLLHDTKPCHDVLIDGQVLNSRPILAE